MISEVDLRDWDHIDFEAVERLLPSLESRNYHVFDVVIKFLDDVQELHRKQTARVPKLLIKEK